MHVRGNLVTKKVAQHAFLSKNIHPKKQDRTYPGEAATRGAGICGVNDQWQLLRCHGGPAVTVKFECSKRITQEEAQHDNRKCVRFLLQRVNDLEELGLISIRNQE